MRLPRDIRVGWRYGLTHPSTTPKLKDMTDPAAHQEWPLSQLIRSRRKELELSERQLAERCGWDDEFGPSDVRSLETGELRFPSTSQVEALAKGLELDVEDVEEAIEASLQESERSQFSAMATIKLGYGRRVRRPAPDGLTTEEDAIKWGKRLCRELGGTVELHFDDGRTVQVESSGRVSGTETNPDEDSGTQ